MNPLVLRMCCSKCRKKRSVQSDNSACNSSKNVDSIICSSPIKRNCAPSENIILYCGMFMYTNVSSYVTELITAQTLVIIINFSTMVLAWARAREGVSKTQSDVCLLVPRVEGPCLNHRERTCLSVSRCFSPIQISQPRLELWKGNRLD